MPLSIEISDLRNLCVQSIAQNLMRHSQGFRNSAFDEKLNLKYRTFQRLFGELLLEKLCHICCYQDPTRIRCFAGSLQLGKLNCFGNKWNYRDLKRCLDFIFTKHTKKINLNCLCGKRSKMTDVITSHIFSKCKDPEDLDLHLSILDETRFLEAVSHWPNLVRLNLSHTSCTDQMVIGVWENVPDLQELFLSFCPWITDDFLLHLCKHECYRTMSFVCRENGSCSNFGKKLKILEMYSTKVSTYGIACALEHLSSLEYVIHCSIYRKITYVPLAVLLLKDVFIRKVRPLIPLKLKIIDCGRHLILPSVEEILPVILNLTELKICGWEDYLDMLTKNPIKSIKSLSLTFLDSDDLDSITFHDFLAVWRDQLEKFVITIDRRQLKMRQVIEILKKCNNLREFWIAGSAQLINEDDDIVPKILSPIENLRVLHFSKVTIGELSEQRYFLEMLSALNNLEILDMSAFIAENVLSHVLEVNRFEKLQKIIITGADMKNVSLEHFVGLKNNLKTIVLVGCINMEHFAQTRRDISRKQNFALNVVCRVSNRILKLHEILRIDKYPF